jgi:CRP/FNR family transcriptional regulator
MDVVKLDSCGVPLVTPRPPRAEAATVQVPAGTNGWQTGLMHLAELLGCTLDTAALAGDECFHVLRVATGATLIEQAAAAESLYLVQTGCFKCVRTTEDGYEHLLGFAMRRDLLGYDGLASGVYACGAVALEDSRVVVLPLALLDPLRRRVRVIDTALARMVARQFVLVSEQAELMAAVAAESRLARFICKLSRRKVERGESPRRLRLCMSRRDIANHLGLAQETISRAFRTLVESGWLRVRNRDVEIVDPEGLRACARSTRGLRDDLAARQPSRARMV